MKFIGIMRKITIPIENEDERIISIVKLEEIKFDKICIEIFVSEKIYTVTDVRVLDERRFNGENPLTHKALGLR